MNHSDYIDACTDFSLMSAGTREVQEDNLE